MPLKCVCTSAGNFRLEGDIAQGTGSRVEYSTHIRGEFGCRDGARTPDNQMRTIVHEAKHARHLIKVFNDHKTILGVSYASKTACDAVIRSFLGPMGVFFSELKDEEDRQLEHEDHGGEQRYYRECPGFASKMIELMCNEEACPGAVYY